MRRLAGWFFLFFTASGFCSLVYQVVWLRLTMASFGVTAPMVSVVLSVFMAGLALGSWGAGRLASRPPWHPALTPLRLYGLAELAIAASTALVPGGLAWGRELLAGSALRAAWDSPTYYVGAGAWVALCLLPFTVAMGATIPLAMWAIRRAQPQESARSFSRLYLANVAGATLGTLSSAFVMIELLGLRGTLDLVAGLNALIASGALLLSLRESPGAGADPAATPAGDPPGSDRGRGFGVALFVTGLASLAMEVVWVRQFTLYLGTVVYAFASILAIYLVATTAGAWLYRRRAAAGRPPTAGPLLWAGVGLAALLPAVVCDPRLELPPGLASGALRLLVGIGPFCALLGLVTPSLVDRWSKGDPDVAGRAYAINVVGGILGPLLAGFAILPHVAEPWALYLLAAPIFALGWLLQPPEVPPSAARAWVPVAAAAIAAGMVLGTRTFENASGGVVMRDHTATVLATGAGMERRLLVNGVGMTYLTPITKMMAHLPLAHLSHPPERGLALCFGMGTTFRSMMSWGIDATAVELVPSVPRLFGYFHDGGPRLLESPRGHVIVDDARRFVEWSTDRYDVIVIDPPPPVEAAGSSLLYSTEFYAAARQRLRPGGILQQWVPSGDAVILTSFVGALTASFRHVRLFESVEGWGLHALASDSPIERRTAEELARRLPPPAGRDLVEWGPWDEPAAMFADVLAREHPLEDYVTLRVGPLRDDRPLNEYFLLRRLPR